MKESRERLHTDMASMLKTGHLDVMDFAMEDRDTVRDLLDAFVREGWATCVGEDEYVPGPLAEFLVEMDESDDE